MKIDKIEQTVCTKNINLVQQIKTKDFTLTPIGNNLANLKTNPGKMVFTPLNLGIDPITAELINYEIIRNLRLNLINFNRIEYCLDVKIPFKLKDCKHTINTFYKTINHFKYKNGKLDFQLDSLKTVQNYNWKGATGYKSSRTIKLYSKFEEKNLDGDYDYDLVRLELIFAKRPIRQNKIKSVSDITLAKKELLEILNHCERTYLKSLNRYSKKTDILIKLLKKELKNPSSLFHA